jgi:hypothetical protein
MIENKNNKEKPCNGGINNDLNISENFNAQDSIYDHGSNEDNEETYLIIGLAR